MDNFFVNLIDRAVLKISGEDRKTFLQGIISNDINKVGPGKAIYACILTPQGKFLFDLFIIEDGDDFLLDVEKSTAEELKKKLLMYKLRSKVEISVTDYKVLAGMDVGISYSDPRYDRMGRRSLSDILPESSEKPYQFYEEMRVSLGIPKTGAELIPNQSFPLQNNMEEMHAIDFDKGCYVGQEVTARSKHRGVVRKKLYVLEGVTKPGEAVMLNGKTVGEITSAAGSKAIARLELDGTDKNPILLAGNSNLKII